MSELPSRGVPPTPLDPATVASLSASAVGELLDRWKSAVPVRGVAEVPERRGAKALVFGDTHSDWPTVEMLAREVLSGTGGHDWLIGLGDYVDRAPPELPFGSAVNAIYLLSLQLAHPERVLLLCGNHETQRVMPILRPEVDDEARALWGRESGIAERVEEAFDRWPIAATTSSGAYLAHAGIPRAAAGTDWRARLAHRDVSVLEEVTWNDLARSKYAGHRGLEISPLSDDDVLRFLDAEGLGIFLRGHDPTEAGRAACSNRVLTLHTSRVYDWAGLYVAELPLDGKVRDLRDVRLRDVPAPPIPAVAPVHRLGGRSLRRDQPK